MPTPAPTGRPVLVPPAVTRARWLLMGLFALAGITFSSWLARIPAVRDALDLSTTDLGGMLLVGSLGALLTVTLAGVVVQRFGSRTGIVASTAVLAVGYVLMGVGPAVGSRTVLAVGIFLNGVAIALGNVPLNVESSRVERAMGRTVIPQFHAAFSIGAVTGSGLGAVASAVGVPVVTQFAVVAALTVAWRLASLRGVVLDAAPGDRPLTTSAVPDVPAHEAATTGTGPRAATGGRAGRRRRIPTALDSWREPRTLLIGVVIMAAALSEGSANDWLSLAVVDGFGRSEAVGGAMLGVFVGAMTVVRLLGTRLIDRYGRVVVLRVSGVVSLAGLLLFGFAPTLELAGLGIVGWGFGAALAVPVGIAAASDDPLRSAGRVAVVSSFSSIASLAAPPLLGLAAESMGARHALVLIGVAMVASVSLAGRVAPEHPSAAPRTPASVPDPVPEHAADPTPAGVPTLALAGPDRLPALALPHEDRRHTVRSRAARAGAAVRAGAGTLGRAGSIRRARATTSERRHDR
ncbi:MFS transporter [Cellulomonas biazotea]|uniref:MFS transporter n=3 Tax=Cellulomonas biazotea TaxID=1709 RepID=UPI0035F08330